MSEAIEMPRKMRQLLERVVFFDTPHVLHEMEKHKDAMRCAFAAYCGESQVHVGRDTNTRAYFEAVNKDYELEITAEDITKPAVGAVDTVFIRGRLIVKGKKTIMKTVLFKYVRWRR